MSPETWKRDREARLMAEVRILELLLESVRQDLYETRQLEGENLALVFGWVKPSEVAEIERDARDFAEQLCSIWLEGEHNLKSKGQDQTESQKVLALCDHSTTGWTPRP